MEALSSKIDSAARQQQMSATLKNTVPALQNAMKQMEASGIMNSVA